MLMLPTNMSRFNLSAIKYAMMSGPVRDETPLIKPEAAPTKIPDHFSCWGAMRKLSVKAIKTVAANTEMASKELSIPGDRFRVIFTVKMVATVCAKISQPKRLRL